jgi:hypothetical protein
MTPLTDNLKVLINEVSNVSFIALKGAGKKNTYRKNRSRKIKKLTKRN